MKILYDFRAYPYFNQRGIGRYIHQLFESAARQTEEKLYVLHCRGAAMPDFSREIQNKIVHCYYEDFQCGMYEENEFDVFINTKALLNYLGAGKAISEQYPMSVLSACKIITCILHDFIPLFFLNNIPTLDWKTGFALQMEALKYLDHIFTNSQFTMMSAVKYIDLDKNRFTCLYGGVDEESFRTANSNLPYKESNRGNHLIYISGDAPHKNNETFVKVFCKAYRRKLVPEDAKLYLLGQANEAYKANIKHVTETTGCKYGKQVIVTGYIPEKKMVELLGTARANMFPSYLEGLGLPILEGYAAGTPCFASGLTATREFVLKECTFDPFDEESMIDAIALAYRDDELCARSLEFGRELLKEINWDNAARRLLDKCRELSGETMGEG